jgi:hypothetical protein
VIYWSNNVPKLLDNFWWFSAPVTRLHKAVVEVRDFICCHRSNVWVFLCRLQIGG